MSQKSKRKVSIHRFFTPFVVSSVFQSQNNSSSESESSSSSSNEEDFADELDRYLSSGCIKGVDDLLRWWHENQASYPHLSHMAKDYLTIPGQYSFCISS